MEWTNATDANKEWTAPSDVETDYTLNSVPDVSSDSVTEVITPRMCIKEVQQYDTVWRRFNGTWEDSGSVFGTFPRPPLPPNSISVPVRKQGHTMWGAFMTASSPAVYLGGLGVFLLEIVTECKDENGQPRLNESGQHIYTHRNLEGFQPFRTVCKIGRMSPPPNIDPLPIQPIPPRLPDEPDIPVDATLPTEPPGRPIDDTGEPPGLIPIPTVVDNPGEMPHLRGRPDEPIEPPYDPPIWDGGDAPTWEGGDAPTWGDDLPPIWEGGDAPTWDGGDAPTWDEPKPTWDGGEAPTWDGDDPPTWDGGQAPTWDRQPPTYEGEEPADSYQFLWTSLKLNDNFCAFMSDSVFTNPAVGGSLYPYPSYIDQALQQSGLYFAKVLFYSSWADFANIVKPDPNVRPVIEVGQIPGQNQTMPLWLYFVPVAAVGYNNYSTPEQIAFNFACATGTLPLPYIYDNGNGTCTIIKSIDNSYEYPIYPETLNGVCNSDTTHVYGLCTLVNVEIDSAYYDYAVALAEYNADYLDFLDLLDDWNDRYDAFMVTWNAWFAIYGTQYRNFLVALADWTGRHDAFIVKLDSWNYRYNAFFETWNTWNNSHNAFLNALDSWNNSHNAFLNAWNAWDAIYGNSYRAFLNALDSWNNSHNAFLGELDSWNNSHNAFLRNLDDYDILYGIKHAKWVKDHASWVDDLYRWENYEVPAWQLLYDIWEEKHGLYDIYITETLPQYEADQKQYLIELETYNNRCEQYLKAVRDYENSAAYKQYILDYQDYERKHAIYLSAMHIYNTVTYPLYELLLLDYESAYNVWESAMVKYFKDMADYNNKSNPPYLIFTACGTVFVLTDSNVLYKYPVGSYTYPDPQASLVVEYTDDGSIPEGAELVDINDYWFLDEYGHSTGHYLSEYLDPQSPLQEDYIESTLSWYAFSGKGYTVEGNLHNWEESVLEKITALETEE